MFCKLFNNFGSGLQRASKGFADEDVGTASGPSKIAFLLTRSTEPGDGSEAHQEASIAHGEAAEFHKNIAHRTGSESHMNLAKAHEHFAHAHDFLAQLG